MKRIKVLPIYPSSPSTFWSFDRALDIIGKKATMPPTGLATAMAMFPQEHFEIMPIEDLNIKELDEEAVKKSDLVATSSMIIQEKSHNEVIDIAHKHGKKVVAGGPFPTVSPDRNKSADYIVAGEAELTLPSFLEDILNGIPKRIYTEEGTKTSSKSLLTKTGKPDLIQTPIPRWDLIPDLNMYHSMGIQYSRGCPFDCEFCNITSLFGREPRTKTIEQMIKEFDTVYNMGYRGGIFLLDDNLIGNVRNLKQFLPALEKWQKSKNYPYDIGTEVSMNLAWPNNREVLEDMVKAGFTSVFLGIESIDPEIIEQMNKKQNLKMPPNEVIRKIQNAGLEVTGGFIVGDDGEKPDIFDNLFKFIQKTGIVIPMVGLLSVAPGTKLAKRLELEGRLRSETNGSNTYSFALDFEPRLAEGFSEKELIDGYKNLLQKLFNPENYYERCRTLDREIGLNHPAKHRTLEGLAILGRFAKHQLKGNLNLETVKYLTETLVGNPKKFPQAVTHAVKYQHFNKITKETLNADAYPSRLEIMYETFMNKYRKISEKYKGDLEKARRKISRKANRLITKAERDYSRINPDFQQTQYYMALQKLKDRISRSVPWLSQDNFATSNKNLPIS